MLAVSVTPTCKICIRAKINHTDHNAFSGGSLWLAQPWLIAKVVIADFFGRHLQGVIMYTARSSTPAAAIIKFKETKRVHSTPGNLHSAEHMCLSSSFHEHSKIGQTSDHMQRNVLGTRVLWALSGKKWPILEYGTPWLQNSNMPEKAPISQRHKRITQKFKIKPTCTCGGALLAPMHALTI